VSLPALERFVTRREPTVQAAKALLWIGGRRTRRRRSARRAAGRRVEQPLPRSRASVSRGARVSQDARSFGAVDPHPSARCAVPAGRRGHLAVTSSGRLRIHHWQVGEVGVARPNRQLAVASADPRHGAPSEVLHLCQSAPDARPSRTHAPKRRLRRAPARSVASPPALVPPASRFAAPPAPVAQHLPRSVDPLPHHRPGTPAAPCRPWPRSQTQDSATSVGWRRPRWVVRLGRPWRRGERAVQIDPQAACHRVFSPQASRRS
jgi:hypothetical protein